MAILRLADKSVHVQLTPEETFKEAYDICLDDGDAVETLAIIFREDNTLTWLQGGGQTKERMLWNLTFLIEELKRSWFK